jgi:hypothetical protein
MSTIMRHHPHAEHATAHPYAWQRHENRNVGGWERAARLFLGAALFAIAFTAGPVWVRAILAIAGTAAMLTSVAAYCPLNRAAGRDSYHHGMLR